MNKVELLPRNLIFDHYIYTLGIWVTFKDRLCIGYRDMLQPADKRTLFSVCVESENDPIDISNIGNKDNKYFIGNAKNLDDASDMIKKYLDNNSKIKIYKA